MLNLPRWGILIFDMAIVIFSICMAHLLRFNFDIYNIDYTFISIAIPLILVVRTLSFFYFKTYTGIIFHTSIEDAQKIFYALIVSSVLLAILNPFSYHLTDHFIVPYSILIIDFMLTIFLMTAYRALVKILYQGIRNNKKDKKYVTIYGAGSWGLTTKQTLDRDLGTNFSVNAFIDDNEKFKKKSLAGIPIYSGEILERFLITSQPDMLIFAASSMKSQRKQKVVELCVKHNVKVLNVPPMDKWINGELSFQQIKAIRIEDLLIREPIQLDLNNIEQQLKGKTILITGAAGSIGSEIARQIIRFEPKQLVLLDQAETPLYELDLELTALNQFQNNRIQEFEIVIGDVRNEKRMEKIFKSFRPEYVYHAAAYKHVPMMETNPSEAILTNIKGTKTVADLAVLYDVRCFVLVSTDKVVNPTNIMGASKRVAEIYIQSLQEHQQGQFPKTDFITTRFGNVLGSNGSVIPLFQKQITAGGPLTVTHPEMMRYFMTIPEACQLVLEAGAMGKGGEIFVFDMGKSIKINDLAIRMIRLSGLEPEKDIQIVYTGLRPGEKLYEELLNHAEKMLSTHNNKILIAQVRQYPFSQVDKNIKELIKLFDEQEDEAIVRLLKKIVPEYISNNSVFEKLDS